MKNAKERFLADVADHDMTEEVYIPSSAYRSILFKQPDSGMYHFRLITWPGYLAISGDMGTFVFTRTWDMFDFFRANGGIDHRYWAEKCVSAPLEHRGDGVTEFSRDEARKHVAEALDERFPGKPPKGGKGSSTDEWFDWTHGLLSAREFERERVAVRGDWTRAILIELAERKETEIRATFDVLRFLADEEDTQEFYKQLYRMDGHDGVHLGADDFPMFEEYTYRFEWCCEAIRWGIQKWDALQAARNTPVVHTDTKSRTEDQAASVERSRVHAPDYDDRPASHELDYDA